MNTVDLDNEQIETQPPPLKATQNSNTEPETGIAPEAAVTVSHSTLIEFPGAHRSSRPAWRNELSERVREIQQRRAETAAIEAEEAARRLAEEGPGELAEDPTAASTQADQRARQLGLVPTPPQVEELNPLVVAALRRIERARKPAVTRPRATRATQAAAVARVEESDYEPKAEPPPALKPARRDPARSASPVGEAKSKAPADRAEVPAKVAPTNAPVRVEPETRVNTERLPNLVAVPPKQPDNKKPLEPKPGASMAVATEEQPTTKAVEPATLPTATPSKTIPPIVSQAPSQEPAKPPVVEVAEATVPVAGPDERPVRRVAAVIDEHWLERHGKDPLPKVPSAKEIYDDYAPLGKRFAGGIVDLLVMAFIASPFAAIIELTIGNWSDPRVHLSMGGIVVVTMFLYLTCSTALAGRTWGMSLFSLLTIDANSALAPTTGQCARRAIVYIISLATLGLGLLYALVDSEGRTLHDRLSRTAVVRE
jgi:uncharacterized RDD family membrane protein YckC